MAGYGKHAAGYLPTLRVEGMENPVVQVVSEAGGEILYTLRIQGREFTPAVFEGGSYSIGVGEPGTDRWQIFLGMGVSPEIDRTLDVTF
jgi:alkaline phosphatase D